MKLRFAFWGLLSLIAVSCSYEESFVSEDNNDNSTVEFYATIDEQPDTDTKVYADENLKVLWNADDRITIFNKNTYNQQYRFTGENGDNAGGFRIVKSDDEFITSNPLDNIYAVYPYRETNKISNSGVVTTSIPSEQTYKANSFGIGANTMVSVAESNMLKFKNVGGYLSLKFYGEGVSVSSITLKSNNGEFIAGDCTVDMSSGTPVSSLVSANAADEITLTCEPPVELGATASEATQFIFVLSPVTLSGGFTVTIATPDGGVFEKSSTNKRIIDRSSITRIGAIEVIPMLVGNIVFADDNFKAYCVENFDQDGDGEVSYDEALLVTKIDVCTDEIESIDEIVYFKNLRTLYAKGSGARFRDSDTSSSSGDTNGLPDWQEIEIGTSVAKGKLTSISLFGLTYLQDLDVSMNNKLSIYDLYFCAQLTKVTCAYCNILSLDFSNSMALVHLECSANQLSSLDVSGCTALQTLACPSNQLSHLDLCNCSALKSLICFRNQLSSLDLSNCAALQLLMCEFNQLSSLDVSSNTALQVLWCKSNQLSSLDVSDCSALQSLSCDSNQLSTLDVSGCSALQSLNCHSNQLNNLNLNGCADLQTLSCYSNQLSSLDVSKNTALQALWCYSNPYLTEIWLKTGQSIEVLSYDTNVATIKYKPEAVDLGLPSGLKWASFNLGASRPEEYGDYYAWGETEPYYSHQEPLTWKEGKESGYSLSSYKWCTGDSGKLTKYCTLPSMGYNDFTDDKTVLDPEDDAAHIKLGGSWRMPTIGEWKELMENCTWTWTTQNGVAGRLVTASNGNSIFLPATGFLDGTNPKNVATVGYYWSSSLFKNGADDSVGRPEYASPLCFTSGFVDNSSIGSRNFGFSVRSVYVE